jgi:hypothetical protein
MLDLANDIRSPSEFKRNTVDLLDRLRKTGHPPCSDHQRQGRARVFSVRISSNQRLRDPRSFFGRGWIPNLPSFRAIVSATRSIVGSKSS